VICQDYPFLHGIDTFEEIELRLAEDRLQVVQMRVRAASAAAAAAAATTTTPTWQCASDRALQIIGKNNILQLLGHDVVRLHIERKNSPALVIHAARKHPSVEKAENHTVALVALVTLPSAAVKGFLIQQIDWKMYRCV
jgi:hypothetical protein